MAYQKLNLLKTLAITALACIALSAHSEEMHQGIAGSPHPKISLTLAGLTPPRTHLERQLSQLSNKLERSRDAYTRNLNFRAKTLAAEVVSLENQLAESTQVNRRRTKTLSNIPTEPLLYALIAGLITFILIVVLIRINRQFSDYAQKISNYRKSEKRMQQEIEARGKLVERLNEKRVAENLAHRTEIAQQVEQLQKALEAKTVAEQKLHHFETSVEAKSFNALQAELNEKKQIIASVNDQLTKKGEIIEQLEAKIADQESLKKELLNANQTIADLQENASRLVAAGEDDEEIEQLNKEIDALIHKLNKKEQDCDFLEDQVDELKEEIEELTSLCESSLLEEQDEEELEEEDSSQMATLTESLNEAEQELELQEKTIADLHHQLNKIRKENDQFKSQLRQLQQEMNIEPSEHRTLNIQL